jgi:hypothetical protein
LRETHFWLFVRLIVTFAVFGALTLAFLHLTKWNPLIRFVVYGVVFIVSAIFSLKLAFNERSIKKLLKMEAYENRFEPLHLLSFPVIFIYSFSLLCQVLWELDPNTFKIIASSYYVSEHYEMSWIMFSFDNVFRAVFLDCFETYHLSVSNIIYSSSFFVESLVFLFKTSLTIFFWRIIFGLFRNWKATISGLKSPSLTLAADS